MVIPVLIHLFNLRKYKTVMFPHTRFLKDIQLTSRKQSQLQHKWLLLIRLLFLASLILAFAQPFFKSNEEQKGNRLQLIYLDNSRSMSAKKGMRTMLDLAKESAIRQVKYAAPGSKFMLITNDRPQSFHPETAEKIIGEINSVDFSAAWKSIDKITLTAQSLSQNEGMNGCDVFYFSDFQQNTLTYPDAAHGKNINFYCLPLRADDLHDVAIDTAFLTIPTLQVGRNNYLVVKTKLYGNEPKEPIVAQLTVNNQVKSVATIKWNDKKESIDTLPFQITDASWQRIQVTVNDDVVRFDDTFRISGRSASNLSVLVLNEGLANPFVQAAFRAYGDFRLNQADINTPATDWRNYNLIVLNGITHIDETLGRSIGTALQSGQSICIFPGKTENTEGLNGGMKYIGDIKFNKLDTTAQNVASLQQGCNLVKDIFEKIPDNVQLPRCNWHYSISSGLNANSQSVMSFRNGDAMLASFTPDRGTLYISSTGVDLLSGNFAGSYFFAPFLYQMAVQSGTNNVFSITAGSKQSVYLPLLNATEKNTMHLYANNTDIIPSQRPEGAGLVLEIGTALHQPGFYKLAAPQSDTTLIGLNEDKTESDLMLPDLKTVKNTWKGNNIKWPDMEHNGSYKDAGALQFPIWKLCIALAVLMLLLETLLLSRKRVGGMA